jgi:hypothetical protein
MESLPVVAASQAEMLGEAKFLMIFSPTTLDFGFKISLDTVTRLRSIKAENVRRMLEVCPE